MKAEITNRRYVVPKIVLVTQEPIGIELSNKRGKRRSEKRAWPSVKESRPQMWIEAEMETRNYKL